MAPAWGTLGPSEGVPWGRLRHDSYVGSQSAAAINFCVSCGEWSLLILRVTHFPNGALILPWDVRRRTTDGAPRLILGAGVSLASALACSLAFCGGFNGRLACKRFYDFPRSELDADNARYYPNRDCSSVVVTTVGHLARRPLFYRRLPVQILGASRAEVRPRIRLVRWLHTVLNRNSS